MTNTNVIFHKSVKGGVGIPGHGRNVVDGFNSSHKLILSDEVKTFCKFEWKC